MQWTLASAIRIETIEQYLVPSSILYLALPYVIFCIGWLRWPWALLGIGLLVMAFIESTRLAFRHSRSTGYSPDFSPRFTWRHVIILLLTSTTWLSLSGAGGIGYQRGDWMKHESVLKDLIEHTWPVIYDFYQTPVPLVYYLAFYLPAALVGKIGGWSMGQAAIFLWAFLGVNLAMLWFWVLVRKSSYWILLLFVLFSGLDLVGKLLGSWAGWATFDWGRMDRWSRAFEYSANTTLLYWVPNQALGGWIACALTLYMMLHIRQRRISWLPFGLSALWSPFATIGLVPYLITEFLTSEDVWHVRFRRYLSWSNLCGLSLLLLVGLFYLSKLYEASPLVRAELPHGFFLSTYPGPTLGGVALLVTFWLTEVGIYAFLIFRGMSSEPKPWRYLFVATLVYLTLLPFYTLGIFNDLAMRASIPSLFCLALLVGRALYHSALGLATRSVLIIALVLGTATNAVELRDNIIGNYQQAAGVQPGEGELMRGIVTLYQGMPRFFVQYVGSYESPFFQYLAKEQQWTSLLEQKPYIAFRNNTILFESYELDNDAGLRPGETVQLISRLHVFFGSIDTNYNISLRLVGEDGVELWREQGWPQNRPTSIWAPSVEWFDTRTISIPAGTPSGIYRLDLSFVDPVTHDLLPATAMQSGKSLGQIVPIGYLTVGKLESKPSYLFPEPVLLGRNIALVGTTSKLDGLVSRGESLDIELFWQALGEIDTDYTGFVQLIAADGRLVAQQDHPPRNGFLPTSIWKGGLIVSDPYTLVVPQDANPGAYSLIAGMYDLESGIRLPVWEDGKSVGDTIMLAHVEVQ